MMLVSNEKIEQSRVEDSHQNSSPPPYDPSSQPSSPQVQLKASASTPLKDDEADSSSEVVANLLTSFVTPETNYVSIYQKHLGVKDTWTINTALQPPPALLARLRRGERKNLDVHSRHGAVDVKVLLAPLPHNNQPRATLQIGSRHKSVQVYVLRPTRQAFHLKAYSKHGKVWVFIPRDFHGLVEHKGKTIFSTAIRQKVTSSTSSKEKGKTFIGDWRTPSFAQPSGSAFTSLAGWAGDYLEMSTKHSTLYVYYVDEEREEQNPTLGKSLLSWFTSPSSPPKN